MGNVNIVKRMLQGSNCPSSKKFYIEDVMANDYVRPMFRKFAAETGAYHDEYCYLGDIFKNFGKQSNSDQENNWKKNLIDEINELYTAGLCNPEYLQAKVLDSRFDNYFNIDLQGNSDEDIRNMYCKFFLLYCYIKPFYTSDNQAKDDFIKKLAEKLEAERTESLEAVSFIFGVIFSFETMKELKTSKPEILQKSLLHMHSTLLNMKPGVMRVLNFDFFNTHESFINDQRDFLVSLIEDPDVSLTTKEISAKIILLLGNTRASGEDLLVAFNLIKTQNLSINVYNELSQQLERILNQMMISRLNKEGSSYKEVYLLTGNGEDPSRSNFSSMTFDENHLYLYNQSVGLFKIGIESSVTIKEGVFYARNLLNDGLERSIIYLNDKVFCWSHQNTENSLSVFDKISLKCAENEDFKRIFNIQKKNLEVHDLNKQTLDITDDNQIIQAFNKGGSQFYRQLYRSPLFTDGQYLFLISINYVKTDQDSEISNLSNAERFYCVEKYDPETLKFINSIKLDFEFDKSFDKLDETTKNSIIDDTDKAKQMLADGSLNQANCYTNGKLLAIGKRGILFLFSLENGRRQFETLRVPFSYGGYNYFNSKFWGFNSIDSSSLTLSSFVVKGFLCQSNQNVNQSQISHYLNKHISEIGGQLKSNSKPIIKRDVMQLISSIVHSRDSYEQNQKATMESLGGDTNASMFLILSLLYKGCQKAEQLLSDFDSLDQNKVDERFVIRTQMFRSEFCVTISNIFFNQLTFALRSCSSIVERKLRTENINEQYQLYFLICLVMTALKSAERLGVTLSSILQDKTEYREFIDSLEHLLTAITDISESISRFDGEESKEELVTLWTQLGLNCRDIKFILLNTCSQSDDTLISKLDEIISNFEQNQFKLPDAVFLDYLTMTSTLDMICKDANSKILLRLLKMFDLLCSQKTSKIVSHLRKLEYNSPKESFTYNEFEQNAEKFIYAVAKKVLIIIYSPYKSIVEEMEKEVKKRKEELELQVAQSMKHYNTVFDIATNCAISIFNASYDVVSLFNETKTEYVTGKVTDEHVISRNKQILQKCSEFYEQLHEIIYKNNRFLDIIHIYSACIVSSKEYSINEHTLNMCTKLSKVLESLTIFSELKPLIAKASESETPQLNKSITELISFIAWGMSKISHDFMICTANIQKNNLHKTMTSKLMSAGPDKKLQEKFTENTQKEIMMINQFVGDLSPISENKNDGDTILEAILH